MSFQINPSQHTKPYDPNDLNDPRNWDDLRTYAKSPPLPKLSSQPDFNQLSQEEMSHIYKLYADPNSRVENLNFALSHLSSLSKLPTQTDQSRFIQYNQQTVRATLDPRDDTAN